jgi:hypothetical protein
LAERLLDMLDVPNGRQIIARALWDLAMQRDAERAVGTVHPLKILSD